MTYRTDWLRASDGTDLFLHQWLPEGMPPRVILLISHGMAEHGGRYSRLARSLTAQGYVVAALDQRGHGQSAQNGILGHFADHGGWGRVTGDLLEMLRHMQTLCPGCPIYLLGHSMGSYIVQSFLLDHSQLVDAVILSGSNAHPPALSRFGHLAARIEARLRAADQPALTINQLSFGQFNRAFRPNRTRFDWLSRDPAEVDAYIADPLCGFPCTAQLWRDLFSGLLTIANPQALAGIRPDLPILIIGGSADPVSAGGGLQRLQQRLQTAGLRQVELHLYPDARHELFNETNREQVTEDLIEWLAQRISAPSMETT